MFLFSKKKIDLSLAIVIKPSFKVFQTINDILAARMTLLKDSWSASNLSPVLMIPQLRLNESLNIPTSKNPAISVLHNSQNPTEKQ